MRTLRIFVSSPGDVAEERVLTRRVIERVAAVTSGWARLEPVFWEHEPLRASAGFQEQIVSPADCDIVVVILWSRLGTRLPEKITRPDGSRYDSGTEFEFEIAIESHRKKGLPDLLVYRKTARPVAPLDSEAELMDRLRQKQALDAFLAKWFRADDGSFTAAFHPFEKLTEYEELLEAHLRKLVEARIGEMPTAGAKAPPRVEWTAGSPFRGLEVFQGEHAPVFFGRTAATSEVLNALRRQEADGRPFVLLLGMSGCGKSSLARAGVLPILTQPGVIEGVALWRTAVLRPGDAGSDPFVSLAASLTRDGALPELGADGTGTGELARMLRENPEAASPLIKGGLSQAAAELARAEGLERQPQVRLALLVDQLEEIFTTEGVAGEDRRRFVGALDALVRSGRVWVLATMRSDFYARCTELHPLTALKEGNGQYDLLPPNHAEIGQMIRRPSQLAGLAFEENEQTGERLDDLLRDAASRNPEALPLLQFTLEELYKQRDDAGLLTLAAYSELGGVEGALAQRAESVFARLEPSVQEAFPSVMSSLITVDVGETESVTRRRASLESFPAGSPARKLVDAYVESRLFVTDRDDRGGAVVSVAHEALLEHWPRLQDWLQHNRELLRVRGRVSSAAERWERENRSSGSLLASGKSLAEADELLRAKDIDLPEPDRRFVTASLARGRRARWLKRAAVAALVVLAVLAAGAAYVANVRRAEAVVAREESEAVTDFLSRMLASVNPRKVGRDVLVRDVLDEASRTVESDLAGQPLIQARLMLTMGDTYSALGLYEPAGPLLDKAQALQAEHLDPDDPILAKTLLVRADLHADQAEHDEALSLYEQALAINESELGPDHPEVANTLNNMGSLMISMGQYEKAIELYKRTLAIREAALKPDDPALGRTLSNLGWSYRRTGEYDKARPLFERALEILENAYGPDYVDLATILSNLGILNAITDNHQAALPLFERSLAIHEKALGPDHIQVGKDLENLGVFHASLGQFEAARPCFERSLAIQKKALGPEHPMVVHAMGNYAKFLKDTGHPDEAHALFREVVRLHEKVLGTEHPTVAEALDDLGASLVHMNKYEEARPLYDRSLVIREKALGTDHPDVSRSLHLLGDLHQIQEQYEEALPLLERALAIVEKALGPEHTDLTSTLGSLASLYRKMGEPEKALSLLDRALAINEEAFGPEHPNVADIEEDRAALFVMAGDNARAHLCLERALAIHEQAFGSDHPNVAGIEEDRGVLFLKAGDYGKARSCFERALAIHEQAKGPDHPAALLAIYNLACVSAVEGKNEEALQHLQQAVERGFDGVFMADDPDLEPLHGNPEFETLVARVRERAGED